MGKSKDGNVTCFMYTQMRIVGLAAHLGDVNPTVGVVTEAHRVGHERGGRSSPEERTRVEMRESRSSMGPPWKW